MRAKIYGLGAAGNKAVISLVDKGLIDKGDVVIINSTLKDVPPEYRDQAISISDNIRGCGKERKVAKDMTLDALKSGKLKLDGIDPIYDKAIIVTSTEGGTGSGSSVIIAKYLREVVNINVEIYAFIGFGDDGRGLQNTIEFFQDMEGEYTIQSIQNSAFMKAANQNARKAEQLANDELAKRITVSLGKLLVDSTQNIDETDLFKVDNTSGYKMIEFHQIDEKIKSFDQFNEILKKIMDSTSSVEPNDPGVQRLAIMCNLDAGSQQFIDYSFASIKDRLGNPYELFTHIEDTDAFPRFIAFIASGMKMPIDAIKEIYEEYKRQSAMVNKNKDNFFDAVRQLQGNAEDDMFNMERRSVAVDNSRAKADFFAGFSKPTQETTTPVPKKKDNSEY